MRINSAPDLYDGVLVCDEVELLDWLLECISRQHTRINLRQEKPSESRSQSRRKNWGRIWLTGQYPEFET